MAKINLKILYINGSFLNDFCCAVIVNNTYKLFKQKGYLCEYFTTKDTSYDNNYKYAKYFPEAYNTTIKYIKYLTNYYYNRTAKENLVKVLENFNLELVVEYSKNVYEEVLNESK